MSVRNFSSTAGNMSLTSTITAGATSAVLDTVAGLPAVPFTLVFDAGAAGEEVTTCTAIAGTTVTISRGEDGTIAVQHTAGAAVRHMATARDFHAALDHVDATAAHGATGAVVGTTNTQTLTNKTISGASNTLSAIPGSALNDASVTQAKLSGAIDATTIGGRKVTVSLTAPSSPATGDVWIPLS